MFPQIFLLFGAFILLCGITHAFQIWTLWNPDYPTEGLIKLVTAAVSLYTAFACWKLMPQATALPSPTQFARLNAKLNEEITEKTAALSAAEALNKELLTARISLEEHDAQLSQTNTRLRAEIEEREKAEATLRQSQKMEAVGQLTGGLAHDFNNMLAVIISSLSIFKRRAARGETSLDRYIDGALDGALRGAALTHRLLAFARQQALSSVPTDPNRLVAGVSVLLQRTLGALVSVETVLAADVWRIKVDQPQLESALINLGVNSRDAMPNGGTLTLETANTLLDDGDARAHGLPAGPYVLIAVTDTGTGMTADIIARACDPFFTTKPPGSGTGLGLSQVHGFVRQSGGHLELHSEVDKGTTVKIFLPRYFGSDDESRDAGEAVYEGRKDVTILVVEDEEEVRALSVDALTDLGYRVVEASNARDALKIITSGADIHLLFTDLVMPDMDGRQLADAALEARPGLKILFTTGYMRNAVVHLGTLDPDVRLLNKPFTIQQLSAEIKAVLDGRG